MKKIICLFMLLLCLSGCGTDDNQPVSRELNAMDTTMTLSAYGKGAERALDDACAEISRLDALFSVGIQTSDVWALNHQKSVQLSQDTTNLLTRAIAISEDTDGAFDPTIAPLMEAWGFTDKNYRIPSAATISTLLQNVHADAIRLDDHGRCTLPQNTSVDLGAIAKGYTADRVMDILKEHHIEHAMISLGGNIQTLGSKPDDSPWRIGIQDPMHTNDIIATLEIHEGAVVTSGGYLRYFEENGVRYHHILDPHTGYPANSGLLSVTIVCKDGTLADALSTALFVMGEEDAIRYWRDHKNTFDCILVTNDNRVLATPNAATALSLSNGEKAEVIA